MGKSVWILGARQMTVNKLSVSWRRVIYASRRAIMRIKIWRFLFDEGDRLDVLYFQGR